MISCPLIPFQTPRKWRVASKQPRGESTLTLDQELARWNVALPADMKRAAPEIYLSMRSSGAPSCRDWLRAEYTGARSSPTWTDLWSAATAVDFAAANAKDQKELITILATDDAVEINLRRLASFSYERRTGDSSGAAYMLAVSPPEAQKDVAPDWMVGDATLQSKAEHQCSERVTATSRESKVPRGRGAPQGGDKGWGLVKGDEAGGEEPAGGVLREQGRGRGRGDGPEVRGRPGW